MTYSTVTEKKLSGLDHLRALAIILVLLYHYRMFQHPQWLDDVIGFGWSGVDLFFVLSGYLISSQLFVNIAAGKGIALPEFFIKRFFRIIPAYVVVLSIYFLFPGFHEREALPPLWKFLTFTQNFNFDLKNFGTFSHVWSLCVEEHFYLLFPLVLAGLLRFNAWKKAVWLLPALFIFGVAIRLYCWYALYAPVEEQNDSWVTWYRHIYYPTYTRLDGLLAGVSIAALFAFRPAVKAWFAQRGNVVLLLSAIVLTGAWFFCEDQHSFHASIFGYPLVAAGYGIAIMAAVSPGCILYRFNSRITALIARLSFGLYLSHKGVIHLAQPLLAKTGIPPKGNLMLLACFLVAGLGAYGLNKAVEMPFLRLRQRVLDQRKKKRYQPVAVLAGETEQA
ncbi:acyltransferase family protein [Chitinophaga arvensicola]|uniref:Peptidoglycan/LPS O-acetylase OafA/YrhL, contains acyltransferase and SGNH-hydrolase domains n=1 Tax=Chitinophaga arvensicola TaxID=29529 RepID=A0A1I0RGM8_9BACT|nr:acyltransferase [Chitinophaga arvensicola]SEW40017.1 Peptidoglycan/LPS O-acetylase OafA/YrhL, contains acyltransferase and SGNH-hydrolase domains [Chitinophaga arvensicola]